jgi:hypothetical protein
MRHNHQIVLTGAIAALAWLTAGEAPCAPETNTASASASPTNGAVVIVPITNHPIVFKGLLRSASARRLSNDPTASAVNRGLRWLRDSQNKDGSWGADTNELRAATGLALLAFFARGETPSSQEFGKTVQEGLKWLSAEMRASNGLARAGQPPAFGHGISTWAVCEAYALTRIPALKPVAEQALSTILKAQRPSGLWDGSYQTVGGTDDVEASVWQVLALKGGLMAGAEAEGLRDGLRKSADGMRKVLEAQPDLGTAAGAALCLQLYGEGRTPTCKSALKSLDALTPDWQAPSFPDPIFRWHLATQVFFREGGQRWVRWNRLFNPMLVGRQVVQQGEQGKDTGYWDSPGSGERFSRVYATALSLLMLEVYQQHYLPTYQPAPTADEGNAADKDVEIKVKIE